MKRYARRNIESNCRDPKPLSFYLESDYTASLRYCLKNELGYPWYEYVLIIAFFVGVSFLVEWWVVPALVGLMVVGGLGLELYVAYTFRKLALSDIEVYIDEDGVQYVAPNGEEDEEGNKKLIILNNAPWNELDEIKVFSDCIVLTFLPTSNFGIMYIPIGEIESQKVDYIIEQMLGFWRQHSQDKPKGKSDQRLSWIFITVVTIAIFAFNFIRHFIAR